MPKVNRAQNRIIMEQQKALEIARKQPPKTVWLEPTDPAYAHEGEWVTIIDIGEYWEGNLVDCEERPPLELLWPKGLWKIDPMKVYRPPPTPDPIIVWLQGMSGKTAPYKCVVRDFGNYWRGRRFGDNSDNPEESWPKVAYKIVRQEPLK